MTPRPQRAFALVIVLALIGLLVLLVYALAALNKVDAQLAGVAAYQTQARQNALTALNLALGRLQEHAGPDDRITGMAGITGVPAGAGNPARHWCGVWSGSGAFLAWLSSGATGSSLPVLTGADSILLATTGSLNTDVTNREHVRVLRIPLLVPAADGTWQTQGNLAYWVGDEGVKLSLVIPDTEGVVPGAKHGITQHFTGVQPADSRLPKVLAYEQITQAGATTVQRQGGFHSHTRTHYGLYNGVLKAGVLNVNSTSARFWEGVGATYNLLRPSGATSVTPATFGNSSNMTAAALWAEAAGDKVAAGPFTSINGFFNNARVLTAITRETTLLDFRTTMNDWLAVRSDTFRIRAYGDAVNPADATKIEAAAYCEAIVQRTAEAMPSAAFGRRFIITYFRWLGPNDI